VGAASALDRARLLVARGELADARRTLDAILAESPDDTGALLLVAQILFEEREGDQALARLRRAAESAPRSSEAWNALARGLHALARDDEALVAAESARGLLSEGDNFRQTAPVYLTLLWCLREKRRYREALAVAEEGLARTPDAVLAQWAGVVEEELAEAEKEGC
jgi:tetratricopeptide (TPR) repeat protein